MDAGFTQGTIIKGIGGFFFVLADGKVHRCKGRGSLKGQGVTPLVGDHVLFGANPDGDGTLEQILPRRNQFIRPPVANVDLAVIVISLAEPDPNFMILDRFLVMAEEKGVEALICVNKTDLDREGRLAGIKEIYQGLYALYPVCGLTGNGLPALKEALRGKTATFAGASGVGKSTLVGRLEPGIQARIGELSAKTGRGKHTTRHVEIFPTAFGGRVMDTPGFTSFQVLETAPEALADCFPDLAAFRGTCRFQDCRHLSEPDCKVREAVGTGALHPSRYESYKSLYAEAAARKPYGTQTAKTGQKGIL